MKAAMLYGRDVERDLLGALLDGARQARSGALAIVGEPGIGKTALLDDTRDRAADMHVLSAGGVESESELPFAALHQLIRPALDHTDRLPAPQAAALEGALGLADAGGQERFLVFAATLTLLSELAERRPVLCVIDDAHWLDAASADAFHFVARRLDAEGIVMLFAAREGEEHGFEASDLPTLRLAGLDADSSTTLLMHGASVGPAPSVRETLVEQTRGNPLALLEIPSVLSPEQLAGEQPLPEALPMTRHVESVFLARVHRLPEDTQRLLLVAAADDSASAALVARAAGQPGVGSDALDRAERAGLLTVRGQRLEFRHPLVRSAVYGAATSSEVRAAHRALADALTGDEEQADRRAWHLAASALEHDDSIVQALEQAAERAQARAAFGAAARALDRAAELSLDDGERSRRLAAAARCASVASDDERASALAGRALPLTDDPIRRAELGRVRAIAEIRRGRPIEGAPLLLRAAREVSALDPGKALDLLLDAAWASNESGDADSQREVYRLAASLAPSLGDERSAFLFNLLGGLGAIADEDTPAAVPLLGRVLAWGAIAEDPRDAIWAGAAALWLGDDEQAGLMLERGAALARARGALGFLAPALGSLGLHHFLAQRFDQAALAGAEAVQLGREVRAENLVTLPLFVLAGVAAVRGDDEATDRHAQEVLRRAAANTLPLAAARAEWALAILDLGRGRWAEALARLEPLTERWLGMASTLVMHTMPDRIEAAVRAGEAEAAERALGIFESWAAHTEAAWVPPRLASCRALLAEGDEATAHFEEAIGAGSAASAFDLPRIQLLYGEHLRRERRRVDARAQLRSAVDRFEALGAEPWAERARVELRASGETARKRDPSTLAQLTPQELQITRLVADGLSNKEIAAQLFLSPRTIDSHLRNVFSKLSITSRTQLARLTHGDALGVGATVEPAPA